jgi:hypothetical protein
MNVLRVWVAFLAGLLVGATLFHFVEARAISPVGTTIHVTPVPMSGTDSEKTVVRGKVVGFTCVPDTTNQSGMPSDGFVISLRNHWLGEGFWRGQYLPQNRKGCGTRRIMTK